MNFLKRVFTKQCLILVISTILIVVDLLLKAFFDGKEFGLINKVLSIYSTHNLGAAWGIFSSVPWLLVVVTIMFLCLLFMFYVFQKVKSNLFVTAFTFIFSGAIGNLIDRLVLGHVRDFIKLDFINFPIFNFADICLTVGVILFGIWIIKSDFKEEKEIRMTTKSTSDILLKIGFEEIQNNILIDNESKNQIGANISTTILLGEDKEDENPLQD